MGGPSLGWVRLGGWGKPKRPREHLALGRHLGNKMLFPKCICKLKCLIKEFIYRYSVSVNKL